MPNYKILNQQINKINQQIAVNKRLPSALAYNTGESYFSPDSLANKFNSEDYANLPSYDENDFQDELAENQSGMARLASGLMRGAGVAGTTFVDNILGGVVGLVQGAKSAEEGNGFWNGFINNDVNKAMNYLQDQLREALPIYQTKHQQDNPMSFDNIFSTSAVGNLLDSLGFSVGSIAAMQVAGGAIGKIANIFGNLSKAEQFAKTASAVKTLASGLFSSNGEALVQAYSDNQEYLQRAANNINQQYQQQVQQIQEQYGDSELGKQELQYAEQMRQQALQAAQETGKKAEARDYWLNIPLLTFSNVIQFGKILNGGYRTARYGSKIAGTLEKGIPYTNKMKTWKGIAKTGGDLLAEGNEEFMQDVIPETAQHYFDEKNLNKNADNVYLEHMYDTNYSKKVGNIFNSFFETFKEGVEDPQKQFDFLTGVIMGGFGANFMNGIHHRDAEGKAHYLRNINFIDSLGQYNDEKKNWDNRVEALNNLTGNDKHDAILKGMMQFMAYGDDMQQAADKDNPKDFKDSELGQTVSLLNLLSASDRISDWKFSINKALEDSPENIKALMDLTSAPYTDKELGTTKETSIFKDIKDLNDPEDFQKAKDIVNKQKQKLLKQTDNFINIQRDLDSGYGDNLTDEELGEATYMKMIINDRTDRIADIYNKGTSVPLKKVFTDYDDALSQQLSNIRQNIDSKESEQNAENVKKAEEIAQKRLILKDLSSGHETFINTIKNSLLEASKANTDKKGKLYLDAVNKHFTDTLGTVMTEAFQNEINTNTEADPITLSVDMQQANQDSVNLISDIIGYNEKLAKFINDKDYRLKRRMKVIDKNKKKSIDEIKNLDTQENSENIPEQDLKDQQNDINNQKEQEQLTDEQKKVQNHINNLTTLINNISDEEADPTTKQNALNFLTTHSKDADVDTFNNNVEQEYQNQTIDENTYNTLKKVINKKDNLNTPAAPITNNNNNEPNNQTTTQTQTPTQTNNNSQIKSSESKTSNNSNSELEKAKAIFNSPKNLEASKNFKDALNNYLKKDPYSKADDAIDTLVREDLGENIDEIFINAFKNNKDFIEVLKAIADKTLKVQYDNIYGAILNNKDFQNLKEYKELLNNLFLFNEVRDDADANKIIGYKVIARRDTVDFLENALNNLNSSSAQLNNETTFTVNEETPSNTLTKQIETILQQKPEVPSKVITENIKETVAPIDPNIVKQNYYNKVSELNYGDLLKGIINPIINNPNYKEIASFLKDHNTFKYLTSCKLVSNAEVYFIKRNQAFNNGTFEPIFYAVKDDTNSDTSIKIGNNSFQIIGVTSEKLHDKIKSVANNKTIKADNYELYKCSSNIKTLIRGESLYNETQRTLNTKDLDDIISNCSGLTWIKLQKEADDTMNLKIEQYNSNNNRTLTPKHLISLSDLQYRGRFYLNVKGQDGNNYPMALRTKTLKDFNTEDKASILSFFNNISKYNKEFNYSNIKKDIISIIDKLKNTKDNKEVTTLQNELLKDLDDINKELYLQNYRIFINTNSKTGLPESITIKRGIYIARHNPGIYDFIFDAEKAKTGTDPIFNSLIVKLTNNSNDIYKALSDFVIKYDAPFNIDFTTFQNINNQDEFIKTITTLINKQYLISNIYDTQKEAGLDTSIGLINSNFEVDSNFIPIDNIEENNTIVTEEDKSAETIEKEIKVAQNIDKEITEDNDAKTKQNITKQLKETHQPNYSIPRVFIESNFDLEYAKYYEKDIRTFVKGTIANLLDLNASELNINYTTNENKELSNFAYKPFILYGESFNTVEGAFQAQKLYYADMTDEEKAKIHKKLQTCTGEEARKIGNNEIKNLDVNTWDNYSYVLMHIIVSEAFTSNMPALAKLINTRGTILTHNNNNNDKWTTDFPGILMYLRDTVELSDYEKTGEPLKIAWCEREGWSLNRFNTNVLPRLNESWQMYFKLAEDQNAKAVGKEQMTFKYGNDKYSEVKSETTLEAIKNGERTATTRHGNNVDYWKQFKIGDIIEFYDDKGETVKVEITQPMFNLGAIFDSIKPKSTPATAPKTIYVTPIVPIVNNENNNTKSDNNENTFTFKDGQTVKTPFTLNEEQKVALQQIDDFANSHDPNNNIFTLSGYAGTGKTSLMEIIADKLSKEGHSIRFSATTHKAVKVLKSRLKDNFVVKTMHSLFKINVNVDFNSQNYDIKNKVSEQNEVRFNYGTIIFIDEASMISDKVYDIILKTAKDFNCKIIFIGDSAQLNPVKSTTLSPVFINKNSKVTTLTKVERTGDNAILKEATNIRQEKPFTYQSEINDEGKGVIYVKHNSPLIHEEIKNKIPQIKENPDSFKILTFTNENVQNFNEEVRNLLNYHGLPKVGEPLMAYTNYGYVDKDDYTVSNSENYIVKEFDDNATTSEITLSNNEKVTLKEHKCVLEDALGEKIIVPFVDIKQDRNNRQTAIKIAKEIQKLWGDWKKANYHQKRAIRDEINNLNNKLFINDNIVEGSHTILEKTIDFAYAMTIHKSQGSTFNNILLDESGIEINSPAEQRQLKYVGISRASDTAMVISKNSIENENTEKLYNKEISNSQKTKEKSIDTTQSNQSNQLDTKFLQDYKGYSGKALGSDTIWRQEASKYGMQWRDYLASDMDNPKLTEENKKEIEEHYIEAVTALGRKKVNANTIIGKLVRRSYLQAKSPDAIFAVGKFTKDRKDLVEGGTGYAIEYAKQLGKPIHFFDQETNNWYSWKDNTFVKEDTPILTPKFAGIGTRQINNNGKKAIADVFEKTINNHNNNTIDNLPKGTSLIEQTPEEIFNDKIETYGIYSKEDNQRVILATNNIANNRFGVSEIKDLRFFNPTELAKIVKGIKNSRNLTGQLQVVSVSRNTDAAMFSDNICYFLKENSKKDLSDPTRVNCLEIWSKHDGLPILNILKACKKYRVAPIVSFSITGNGGTALEPGVLKSEDLMERIESLIKGGYLNPKGITIRIDPILYDEEGKTFNKDKIKSIIQKSASWGVKKFITSTTQTYDYDKTRSIIGIMDKAIEQTYPGYNYDWKKYYGIDEKTGGINYSLQENYANKYGDFLVQVMNEINEGKSDENKIEIQSCAIKINGIKPSACLDPDYLAAIVGVEVRKPDATFSYPTNKSRGQDRETKEDRCSCYAYSSDLGYQDIKCASFCAFCYAVQGIKRNIDGPLFYNKDGNLKSKEELIELQNKNYKGLNLNSFLLTSDEKSLDWLEQVNEDEAKELLSGLNWHTLRKLNWGTMKEVQSLSDYLNTKTVSSAEDIFSLANRQKKLKQVLNNTFMKPPLIQEESAIPSKENINLIQTVTPTLTSKVNSGENATNNLFSEDVEFMIDTKAEIKTDDYISRVLDKRLQKLGINVNYLTNDQINKEKDNTNNIVLKNAKGIIYGFTKDGQIYLNSDNLDLNAPLHEFTHIWDQIIRNSNKKLWEEGKDLLKQTDEWKKVIEDPNYANIKNNEDEVASEVHARLTSANGVKYLTQLQQQNKSLFDKIKVWITKFWKSLSKLIEQDTHTHLNDFINKPLLSLIEDTKENYINNNKELQSIKQQAINNGTFMKAPNGNKTNLNEQQWLQVRTKAFKEWFGDWENDPANASKVVDENGEPLIVYHGSPKKNIFIFNTNKVGSYFSNNKDFADAYQGIFSGKTYYVFLNLKNPLIIDGNNTSWTNLDIDKVAQSVNLPISELKNIVKYQDNTPIFKDLLYTLKEIFGKQTNRDYGYAVPHIVKLAKSIGNFDGVYVKNIFDVNKRGLHYQKANQIVAFNSNQIKSATNNNGEFSTTNDDIRYSIRNNENNLVNLEKISNFADLNKETKQNLINKDITEESFNVLPENVKDYLKECSGI